MRSFASFGTVATLLVVSVAGIAANINTCTSNSLLNIRGGGFFEKLDSKISSWTKSGDEAIDRASKAVDSASDRTKNKIDETDARLKKAQTDAETKAKKYAADAKVKAEKTKAEAKVGALPEVPYFALILLLKTRFVGLVRPRLDDCMASTKVSCV
ncbi:hypothetical protein Naga_100247g5 [Nannochloropsis gaditana]|uniref:Uncharacterized protein n=1 Tax=Nannochloropsis gaditana TaxID=72520 RepID=W7UAJ5_9STRA|nr:hypothetical protein Naga_100247g5 [Nannochloropsis gaditana]